MLEKVADGRVFTGRQAVDLKLVDQLGDEKAAVAWLVAEKKIKSELPVRDYKLNPRFGDLTFLRDGGLHHPRCARSELDCAPDRAGQASCRRSISLGLDGMLALWQSGGLELRARRRVCHSSPVIAGIGTSPSWPFVTPFRVPHKLI